MHSLQYLLLRHKWVIDFTVADEKNISALLSGNPGVLVQPRCRIKILVIPTRVYSSKRCFDQYLYSKTDCESCSNIFQEFEPASLENFLVNSWNYNHEIYKKNIS